MCVYINITYARGRPLLINTRAAQASVRRHEGHDELLRGSGESVRVSSPKIHILFFIIV